MKTTRGPVDRNGFYVEVSISDPKPRGMSPLVFRVVWLASCALIGAGIGLFAWLAA